MNAASPRPHQPVLLQEVLAALAVKPDGIYLDGTIGAAGHARAIAERLETGLLVGLDCDPEALALAQSALAPYGERVKLMQSNFARLNGVLDSLGIAQLDGILLDLGISLTQLDTPQRGLSFRLEGPLDMRLDPTLERTAADLVDSLSAGELTKLLLEYGEERWAARIATKIVEVRRESPIETTRQLVEIIARSVPARVRYRSRIHPATRVFQALRIAVNKELENLQRALEVGFDRLRPSGRFAVISFHSLEDRIVKRHFKSLQDRAEVWGLIRPSEEECIQNPRARSAKLRVACRVA